MKNDLNIKIVEIYSNFEKEMQGLRDERDIRVAKLFEEAEEEYIQEIKKDINL